MGDKSPKSKQKGKDQKIRKANAVAKKKSSLAASKKLSTTTPVSKKAKK